MLSHSFVSRPRSHLLALRLQAERIPLLHSRFSPLARPQPPQLSPPAALDFFPYFLLSFTLIDWVKCALASRSHREWADFRFVIVWEKGGEIMIREKKKSSNRRASESPSRHDCPLCKSFGDFRKTIRRGSIDAVTEEETSRPVSARVHALRGVIHLPEDFDEREFKAKRLASRFGARALRVSHRADAERAQGERMCACMP